MFLWPCHPAPLALLRLHTFRVTTWNGMQSSPQPHPAPISDFTSYFLISFLNFTFQLYFIHHFKKCQFFFFLGSKGFENANLLENTHYFDFSPWQVLHWSQIHRHSWSSPHLNLDCILYSLPTAPWHIPSILLSQDCYVFVLFCSSLDDKVLEGKSHVLFAIYPHHIAEGVVRIKHSVLVWWMNQCENMHYLLNNSMN